MAKGYWIGRVDVHNEEGYKPYAAANAAIFKKFGGRFVVRAGKFTGVEGESRSRNVVIEFPDYETARRNIRKTSRCGSRIRSSISSSSKAMTARSPEACAAGLRLGRLPEQVAPAIGRGEDKPCLTCV
jgi:uncharacterized protein (DUF1330 family)